MRIIHMSDIHLTKDGRPIWGTDTMGHFNKSIEIICGMKDIDAIIVTGDISNDGSIWTYQYADEMFASLRIPTYCCPGNHDSLKVMLKEHVPSFYQISPPAHIIKGWKIVTLNSVILDDVDLDQNKARGFISESSMNHLKQELDEGLPTIIALHHPPVEPGGWLNRKLLDNRNDFNRLLFNYSNARLVIYGHIHYFTDVQLGQTRYSSSTSIGFAFDKELPKFQIADGLEGFSLIETKNNSIDISNILLSKS